MCSSSVFAQVAQPTPSVNLAKTSGRKRKQKAHHVQTRIQLGRKPENIGGFQHHEWSKKHTVNLFVLRDSIGAFAWLGRGKSSKTRQTVTSWAHYYWGALNKSLWYVMSQTILDAFLFCLSFFSPFLFARLFFLVAFRVHFDFEKRRTKTNKTSEKEKGERNNGWRSMTATMEKTLSKSPTSFC